MPRIEMAGKLHQTIKKEYEFPLTKPVEMVGFY